MKESFQPKVEIKEVEREYAYPEKNAINAFSKLFWMLGWVTKDAKRTVDTTRPLPERTLAVRRERAKLLERFKQADSKEEKKAILEEARERDKALERFMFQKEITVSREDIGEATVRYVDLEAPEGAEPKPPVALIPGISNDLACVDTIAQELNVRGRRVVTFGYPSGSMGKMSPEFVKAVKDLPGVEAHSRFFGPAIKEVMKDEPFELWGFSTGGTIVGEMLANQEVPSEQVERAVLLNPAGGVKMNLAQLWTGLAREVRHAFEKNIAAYSYIYDSKTPRPAAAKKAQGSVFQTLCERIVEPFKGWGKMKVKKGGEIISVSTTEDAVTHCAEYFKPGTASENIRPIVMKGGHMAPVIDTDRILNAIEAKHRP